MQGHNVLCAAETGSGKTLSYLAPIFHRLRHEEQEEGLIRQLRHPRAMIVVPSKELVGQVHDVAKTLSHHAKCVVEAIYDRKPICPEKFQGTFDIVVTTPKKLFYYLDNNMFSLSELRYLVIDEADTLMDKDFGVLSRSIMKRVADAAPTCQHVFVSATIPASLHQAVQRDFGRDFLQIVSPKLHRTHPTLKQRFIELSGHGDNKQRALMRVLMELPPQDYPTLIFCNTLGSCRALDAWLSTVPEIKDVTQGKIAAFHSRIPRQERHKILQKFDQGEVNTLICTDIASRGLDTTKAQHVILYDFPYSAADYLHRVGRTARYGREGRATSLISRRDQELASQIQKAIRKRAAISS